MGQAPIPEVPGQDWYSCNRGVEFLRHWRRQGSVVHECVPNPSTLRILMLTHPAGWACFTIEAGLAFCWSFQLMQSVYGLAESPSMHRPLALINRIGKPLAIFLPIIQAGLLQLTPLKKSAFWYFFTADILCGFPRITPLTKLVLTGTSQTFSHVSGAFSCSGSFSWNSSRHDCSSGRLRPQVRSLGLFSRDQARYMTGGSW